MDINTELTYVTCIYDDLFTTEFGGRPDPAWRRYYFGIESSTKMLAPIVIFTWPHNVTKVQTHYKNFLGEERFNKQIKVIAFDLYDSPFYELIKSIKTYEQGYGNDRSYDLVIAKFIFLQKVTELNYFDSKYVFWIDAGLSHSALFPHKYLDKSTYDKQWTECSLFTPSVVTESIKRCKNTILFLRCNAVGHWLPPELVNWKKMSEEHLWYIVGGYFGGPIQEVKELCLKTMAEFVEHIKVNNVLLLEEQVLTIHVSFNYDKYVYESFDRWYHEDSGDWVKPHIINKKSFYRIFEEFNNI